MIVSLVLAGAILLASVVWATFLAFTSPRTHHGLRLYSFVPLTVLASSAALAAFALNRSIADRRIYVTLLAAFDSAGFRDVLQQEGGEDPLFVAFVYVVSLLDGSEFTLYIAVSLVSSIFCIAALRRLLSWHLVPLAFALVLAMGLYLNYTSVAIRQGLALSVLLYAISCLLHRDSTRGVLAGLMAILFHWSAAPFALIAVVLRLRRFHTQGLLVAWAIFAVLYGTGMSARITQPLVSFLPAIEVYTDDGLGATYTAGTARLDFLFVSGCLVLAAHLAARFLSPPGFFMEIYRLYLAFNSVFLLFGAIYYSDRLAVYSWYLAPVMLLTAATSPKTGARTFIVSSSVVLAAILGVVSGSFEGIIRSVAQA